VEELVLELDSNFSKKEDAKMPLITISRSIGCGGSIIAQLVADALKLELYDDQRLQEEAVSMGIRSEDLKSLDEKAPGLLDRILGKRPEIYLDLMEAVVYEVAKRGDGVILGHGGQILLRDFGCVLRVFLSASESTRVENMMVQRGLSRKAAEKLIHERDHEQKRFFEYAFHKDRNDPSLYDLIMI
jgi:cytidylate kinase